jgi:hypothetical protein
VSAKWNLFVFCGFSLLRLCAHVYALPCAWIKRIRASLSLSLSLSLCVYTYVGGWVGQSTESTASYHHDSNGVSLREFAHVAADVRTRHGNWLRQLHRQRDVDTCTRACFSSVCHSQYV